MSEKEKEINALLHLIDDPDEEVFDTVADKLLHYGSGIIPRLESLWETTPDQEVQERLELLIHQVRYQNLKIDFETWNADRTPDLLSGAVLVAKYQYPGLVVEDILDEIKKMERNIWLEMNNYLTPLEKINVLNGMLFSYYKMKGLGSAPEKTDLYFINKVMETKTGNALSLGLLYQIICQRLNIPIYAIGLPRQFILGYFDFFAPLTSETGMRTADSNILFYVDPLQGQIYTQKDVKVYLKKLKIPSREEYFKPQSVRNIIKLFLQELSICYKKKGEDSRYEELQSLKARLQGE